MRLSILTLNSLFLLGSVSAHGGMKFPVTRNLARSHFCPHCANGKGACGNGRGSQWTTSEDPTILHGDYETSRTVLYGGGTIEVELWMTVGRKGILTVELCDSPQETFTSDCFKRLKRDPTDTRLSPYLPDFPEIVFLLTDDCMTRATLDSPAKVRFLIPESTHPSSHGILRMYWNTGTSCSPHEASTTTSVDSKVARFETLFNDADCRVAISPLESCGADCPRDECGGEKFINCADVAIVQSSEEIHVTSSDYTQIPIGEAVATTALPTTTNSLTTLLSSIDSSTHPTTDPTTISAEERLVGATSSVVESSTALPSTFSKRALGTELSDAASTAASVAVCASPLGDEESCKSHIKGSQAWADSYCRGRCHTISSGEDEAGRRWCAIQNICDLTKCVARFYSNICLEI